MPITEPKSDFDRYEKKQEMQEENQKTGAEIYLKGEKKNGKKDKK